MADKITLKSSSYDGRYMQLVCTQTPNGGAKNTSTIKWTLSAVGGNNNFYSTGPIEVVINGTTVYSKSRTAWSSESFPAAKGSKSGELTVSHKTDGTKSIKVSFSTAIYTSTVSTYSETWELDSIPRYGTATQSLSSKTETSIKMNWASDSTVDYIWYSKDNGTNWTGLNVTDGKSGSYTISGLTANTAYKIKTRIRRKDSQLTTDSSALSVTTYDYPYCTSSPNFVIGDALTLKFYNPLSRAFSFYIIANGTEIDLEYKCSSTEYKGVNNATSSVPSLYATIPNAKSGKYKVKVVYGNSTKTRDNGNTFSIKESECYPAFSSFTYKDTNTKVTNVTGSNQLLVGGLSTVTVEIPVANKMTTKNSATPKRYVATVDTVSKQLSYSATAAVSVAMGTISGKGTKRISVTAYDSRELPKTAYKDVTVYEYSKPIVNATVKRLNNFEEKTTLSVSGTYSRLTINGADKNTISKVEYRYRETGGTWGSWTTLTTTLSSGKFTCNNVTLYLDNSKSFDFEVKATDKLGEGTKTAKADVGQAVLMVSSNKKLCYMNGKEMAFREDVATLRRYTNIPDNTDLNTIKSIGTYKSTSKAHTDTMTNTPSGLSGGFRMVVSNWTGNETYETLVRQELYYYNRYYVRSMLSDGVSWSAWQRLIAENDIFYSSGDTYSNSAIVYLGGHITSGSKAICTNINVPKRLDNISSITVNSYSFTVRTVAGSYILDEATSGFTVKCVKADACNVQITITSPTALSATNNTPVSVAIYGLSLTFN